MLAKTTRRARPRRQSTHAKSRRASHGPQRSFTRTRVRTFGCSHDRVKLLHPRGLRDSGCRVRVEVCRTDGPPSSGRSTRLLAAALTRCLRRIPRVGFQTTPGQPRLRRDKKPSSPTASGTSRPTTNALRVRTPLPLVMTTVLGLIPRGHTRSIRARLPARCRGSTKPRQPRTPTRAARSLPRAVLRAARCVESRRRSGARCLWQPRVCTQSD